MTASFCIMMQHPG